MPRTKAQRAQIFQSFDALKGFREILKEQERIVVPKKILSEDDLAELDYKIHQVKVGMIIQVVYYDKGEYIQLEGVVSKINLDTKVLIIVKTKINLLKIISLNLIWFFYFVKILLLNYRLNITHSFDKSSLSVSIVISAFTVITTFSLLMNSFSSLLVNVKDKSLIGE